MHLSPFRLLSVLGLGILFGLNFFGQVELGDSKIVFLRFLDVCLVSALSCVIVVSCSDNRVHFLLGMKFVRVTSVSLSRHFRLR